MVHIYCARPPSVRPRCLSGEMQRPYHVQISPSEGAKGVGGSDLVGRASPSWGGGRADADLAASARLQRLASNKL